MATVNGIQMCKYKTLVTQKFMNTGDATSVKKYTKQKYCDGSDVIRKPAAQKGVWLLERNSQCAKVYQRYWDG